MTKPRILLVDTLNCTYQLFYLKEKNIVLKFLKDLNTLKRNLGFHKIIFSCDLGRSAYRRKLYPAYKQKRIDSRQEESAADKARRKDLYDQTARLIELAPAFGIEVLKEWNVESDDIISGVVNKADLTSCDIAIYSTDTDLLQLLRPGVAQRPYSRKFKIFDVQVPPTVWVNTKRFIDLTGITPEQYVHYKSLAGDKSDNLISPRDLGHGTALEMIKRFGSLQGVEANVDKLDSIPRIRKGVIEELKFSFCKPYRNFQLISLNHSSEVYDEIFSQEAQEKIRETVEKITEPPEVDKQTIEEFLYEMGEIKILDNLDDWCNVWESRNF